VFCDKRRSLEVGGDTEASLMKRWHKTVWFVTLAMVIVTTIGLLAQGASNPAVRTWPVVIARPLDRPVEPGDDGRVCSHPNDKTGNVV
jgi:hypothetical protein